MAITGRNGTKKEKQRKDKIDNLQNKVDDMDIKLQAMSKAEFEALAEQRRRKYKGSGFVEFGKQYQHWNSPTHLINQGLYEASADTQKTRLWFGSQDGFSNVGTGKTDYPIANVNGIHHKIEGVNWSISGGFINAIPLPPAPDGTKTYNTETGVVTQYATSNEAFEGLIKNGDFRNGTTEWTLSGGSFNVVDGVGILTGTDTLDRVSQAIHEIDTSKKYKMKVSISSPNDCSFGIYKWHPDLANADLVIYDLKANEVRNIEYETQFKYDNTSVVIRMVTATTLNINSVSVMPVTESVITSRQDLCFLESFHQAMSLRDDFCPLGNTQFGATTFDGIPTVDLTGLGIQQGYSTFGEWYTETTGRMMRWSTLSKAEKLKLVDNHENNIYYDSEADELIQVRYRIRVIEGLGNDWNNARLLKYNSNKWIFHKFSVESVDDYYHLQRFITDNSIDAGLLTRVDGYAIPICLVQR